MTAKIVLAVLIVLAIAPLRVFGQRSLGLAGASLPTELLAPGAGLVAAARTSFLEGPSVDAQGDLYFSDIMNSRILKMTPAGVVSVFREDSGRTNGNTFDARGRLISCEGAEMGPGGRRRVVRTDMTTGQITVLTERYEGKRYNSPNDVCVDPQGRIWFTDPYYMEDRSILELDQEAVYRIDLDGKVTRVVSQPQVERPNGLAITPDGKTLYLIDSHPRPGGARKVWAFAINADGTVSNQRLVFDFGKGRGGDGMRLDMQGNLWVAGGILLPRSGGENTDVPAGVYVISPDGKLIGRIPIPEDVTTNLAFGGPDRKLLYVVSGKGVYKIPLSVAGYALYPPLAR
jgi:gluconolactonase